MRYIVGIDPGNVQTAYCIVDGNLKPVAFGKQDNELMWCSMIDYVVELAKQGHEILFAIEMIASYGMPVGKEVFDTVLWIGRMQERLRNLPVEFVYRKDEKMTLCYSMKANDATIKQALIDRFAPGTSNYGKGTKEHPGWFYGFRADIWAAYAVAVTYNDKFLKTDGS